MVITKIIFRLDHERSSQVNFTIDTAIACFLGKPVAAGWPVIFDTIDK
ncbi:MAG: hypothetical protein JGK37_28905 [Microcoleus sp. PH2017_06_SFM_O_A]|nr:hypothetical protein [Microcoleus sp. PH2017_18_LLB_O_A]MCC3469854.1 hypothetical protein [Microcoleus sp. PH2017_06_SFM_O_A]MCC3516495.1 hypothetical protein [Microcoleus sp. PH2017_18_LLB_O_A]